MPGEPLAKRLRILVVEDSPDDAELLLRELSSNGYEVAASRVDTEAGMADALRSQTWDVVLSDFRMPTFSGSAALKLLRDSGIDIPFIIVSGTIGEEMAVHALKTGASDFVIKGRLARLVPAIERELRDAARRRERAALQAEFLEAQARLAFALDAAGAGTWEFNVRTRVMRWIAPVSQLLGLPPRPMETTLDTFRNRVHADDLAMVDAAIAHSIETDAPYRVEFRVVWPNGTARWIAAKGRVTRDESGAPLQMMGIAVDVTDRKELEGQLHHAHKLESLGQFAGSIAHDFNNLLTAIGGFSEILLEDLAPESAGFAMEIKKAAESGQRLTRQLTAFSRQQEIKPALLDLNESVTSTAGIVKRLLGDQVQFETKLGTVGRIWADMGQLEQVLVNLATNARDAMPHGGRLRIETSAATVSSWDAAQQNVSAGKYAVLSVSDSGVGIPPEVQARMFEPFFTTKGPDKGTGFGLATVYGIVRQSHGFVTVTSVVGEGTTFNVHLPEIGKPDTVDIRT